MPTTRSEDPEPTGNRDATGSDSSTEATTHGQSATIVEMSGATRATDPNSRDLDVDLGGEAEARSPSDHETPDTTLLEKGHGRLEKGHDRLEKKHGRNFTTLLLVLLLVSVAINVIQVRQQRRVATQSAEISLALDRAMVRIDQETIRANQAEGSLSEIDRSVDNVQERITDLQSALSKLSKSTAR